MRSIDGNVPQPFPTTRTVKGQSFSPEMRLSLKSTAGCSEGWIHLKSKSGPGFLVLQIFLMAGHIAGNIHGCESIHQQI